MKIELTHEDLVREAKRELGVREAMYPQWVESGKLTQATADRQLAAQRLILEALLQNAPPEDHTLAVVTTAKPLGERIRLALSRVDFSAKHLPEDLTFEEAKDLIRYVHAQALESKVYEAEVERYKKRTERAQDKLKEIAERAKIIKEWLAHQFRRKGIEKIHDELTDQTWTLVASGQPKVDVRDIESVPSHLLKASVDKKAALAEYKKTGEPIPGLSIERGYHIRVS